jgi:hypothetical protein
MFVLTGMPPWVEPFRATVPEGYPDLYQTVDITVWPWVPVEEVTWLYERVRKELNPTPTTSPKPSCAASLPVFGYNLGWYAFAGFALVTTVLWGRIYCGRICAFGALTQLMDAVLPSRWRVTVPPVLERRASYIKYGILFGAIGYYLATREIGFYRYIEPFWMFSFEASTPLWVGLGLLLVASIFVFVSKERLARWTPLMLWPLIGAFVWRGSEFTGASLNPARSAGPALAFSDFDDLWLYLLAPLVGARAGAAHWRRRHPRARPMTAKLFHDPCYPCSLGSSLPALAPTSPGCGGSSVTRPTGARLER